MPARGDVRDPEQTAQLRILDWPRAVTAVPAWRGLQVRGLDSFPGPGRRVLSYAVNICRWQQQHLTRSAP